MKANSKVKMNTITVYKNSSPNLWLGLFLQTEGSQLQRRQAGLLTLDVLQRLVEETLQAAAELLIGWEHRRLCGRHKSAHKPDWPTFTRLGREVQQRSEPYYRYSAGFFFLFLLLL